jgi:N-methylhydantoinase A
VRDVIFDGVPHPTPVLHRDSLDGELTGPAVLVEDTATTVVPPGCLATAGPGGFLVLKVNP